MKTLGSHPGAILFRLSVMAIIVAILVVIFFRYVDDTRVALERESVLQTKRVIDSALAVAFASFAVDGRLDELNRLDGGNPFAFLEQYRMLPASYRGEIDNGSLAGRDPGWYFDRASGYVVYLPRFQADTEYFRVVLLYEDRNGSGLFEAGEDSFRQLQFIKKPRP